MRPTYETEIGIDCKLVGGNKMKVVNKKSEWNSKVDETQDLVT